MGGGGGTPTFSYIHTCMAWNIFWFKILKFKSLGVSKFQIFIWECPDIPDIFKLGKQ